MIIDRRELRYRLCVPQAVAAEIPVDRNTVAAQIDQIGRAGAIDVGQADAAAGEGAVTLDRAETLMSGAPRCAFRYKFAPRP